MMFSATGEQASLKGCRALVGLQAAACQVLMFGVQIVLILRGACCAYYATYGPIHIFSTLVEALYYEKLCLRLLLRALFFGEVITVTVLLGTVIPEITYGVQCVVTWFPPRSIGYLYVSCSFPLFSLTKLRNSAPPICLEALLFILTMIKFYRAVRGGWGREPIMTRFLADGIWAFALPFSASVDPCPLGMCICRFSQQCLSSTRSAPSGSPVPGPPLRFRMSPKLCAVGCTNYSVFSSWMIAAPGFAVCAYPNSRG